MIDVRAEFATRQPPVGRPFPDSEYERRLTEVRRRMAEQGIGVLVLSNPSNICYLTGFESATPNGYALLLVPEEGELALQVSEIQYGAVLASTRVTDIITIGYYTGMPAEQLRDAILERGWGSGRVGVEPRRPKHYSVNGLDAHTYLALQAGLPAELVDVSDLVLDVRSIKSELELDSMRGAAEFTAIGLRASREAVREGATDNQIAAALHSSMIAAGSEGLAFEPFAQGGWRSGWGSMAAYGRTTLGRGDTIFLEYSGSYNHYNAPIMRSLVIGEPSAEMRRAEAANLECLELLLGGIRPGRTSHDVAVEAAKSMAGIEDDIWWHGIFGYSVGLGITPTWTESTLGIFEGSEAVLEPGMAFHLPICLILPTEFTVGISESVIVTESGCELLTSGEDRRLVVR